jgi:hypothetical protein
MMSPTSFVHPVETLQPAHRYMKADSPQSPRHHHAPNILAMPSHSSSVIQTYPPSTSRVRGTSEMKSPTSAKRLYSPLSLASITSPYNSESQSKNYHAQTFTLGERLRRGPLPKLQVRFQLPQGGPVMPIIGGRPRVNWVAMSRRRRRRHPRNCTWIIPPAQPYPRQRRHLRCRRPSMSTHSLQDKSPEDTVIRRCFYPVLLKRWITRKMVIG